jgi:hypothetical protein
VITAASRYDIDTWMILIADDVCAVEVADLLVECVTGDLICSADETEPDDAGFVSGQSEMLLYEVAKKDAGITKAPSHVIKGRLRDGRALVDPDEV